VLESSERSGLGDAGVVGTAEAGDLTVDRAGSDGRGGG
jgi:hypothetical protein